MGFAAKVSGQPVPAEVAKLDAYVTQTLYGVKKGLPFGASLQCVEGEEASESPSCGPPEVVGPTADGIMAVTSPPPLDWPLDCTRADAAAAGAARRRRGRRAR